MQSQSSNVSGRILPSPLLSTAATPPNSPDPGPAPDPPSVPTQSLPNDGTVQDSGTAKQPTAAHAVKETKQALKAKDASGSRCVNQYSLGEVLGRGSYGKVRRCTDRNTGVDYAVKILKKSLLKRKRVGQFGNALQGVQREIAIWKKLDHPHVVRLVEVLDDEALDKLYLVSELVEGGPVVCDATEEGSGDAADATGVTEDVGDRPAPERARCRRPPPTVPVSQARIYLSQMLDGLAYLHFQHVCHRDIKPANLLLSFAEGSESAQGPTSRAGEEADDETSRADSHAPDSRASNSAANHVAGRSNAAGVLKIADFGVSQVFQGSREDLLRSTAGTAAFLSPEMLSGGAFSGKKQDVWACGMTLYAMLHGRPAFMAPTLPQIYELIRTADVTWAPVEEAAGADGSGVTTAGRGRRHKGLGAMANDRALELARDFVMTLLDRNPETRPSAEAAQRHPFLTGYRSLRSLPLERISVDDADIENAIRPTIPFHVAVRIAALGRKLLALAARRRRASVSIASSATFEADLPGSVGLPPCGGSDAGDACSGPAWVERLRAFSL